jgi:hypothetical protein
MPEKLVLSEVEVRPYARAFTARRRTSPNTYHHTLPSRRAVPAERRRSTADVTTQSRHTRVEGGPSAEGPVVERSRNAYPEQHIQKTSTARPIFCHPAGDLSRTTHTTPPIPQLSSRIPDQAQRGRGEGAHTIRAARPIFCHSRRESHKLSTVTTPTKKAPAKARAIISYQQVNESTYQRINVSTYQRINESTYKCIASPSATSIASFTPSLIVGCG